MLGKLLKYEFKSTARIFLPLYAMLLVVAIINGFFINSEVFNIQGLLMTIFGSLLIALFVITVVVLVQRFSKNLLGDEGYLMFTLPVKSSSILLSKYLVALLWTVLSVIVSVIAFFSITFISSFMDKSISISEIISIFSEAVKVIFGNGYLPFAINMVLLMFITYSIFIFTVYLALSMGQLPLFNKHRNVASFMSFIGINIVLSFIKNLFAMLYYNLYGDYMSLNIEIDATNVVTQIVNNGFVFSLAISIILLIALFLVTKFILDKNLNLE